MDLQKKINPEIATIIGSTFAIVFTIVFSINGMRTDLDSKIDRMANTLNSRMDKMDERWYELLTQLHTLDKEVTKIKPKN